MSLMDSLVARLWRTQKVEYLPPEGSTETDPPYGSPEIDYWMVVGGQRAVRHRTVQDAFSDGAACERILLACAVWVVIELVVAVIGTVFWSFADAPPPMANVMLVSTLLAFMAGAAVFLPRTTMPPFRRFYKRFDISADEAQGGFVLCAFPLLLTATALFVSS